MAVFSKRVKELVGNGVGYRMLENHYPSKVNYSVIKWDYEQDHIIERVAKGVTREEAEMVWNNITR